VYALDAGDRLVRWRFDAGAPILSGPARLDEYLVFSARQQLFAVDATTGKLAWSVPGRGFSCGRAACDGQRVFTSAADGYARAHDLHTGREVWSHQMVSGDEHRVAWYSGWDNVVVLADGAVIVATVDGSLALEAPTGVPRWRFPGSTMYPPAVVLGDGTILLITEQGVISRVELSSGRTRRAARRRTAARIGAAYACRLLSARVIVDGTLIAGDQNGVVHGIRLPYNHRHDDDRPSWLSPVIRSGRQTVLRLRAADAYLAYGDIWMMCVLIAADNPPPCLARRWCGPHPGPCGHVCHG
jgi:outer membrane protein assembly factor BamB